MRDGLAAGAIFLLVGAAALFAGYDQNVFGLATPQIQAELHIPENQVGLTVAYFRLAAIFAMLIWRQRRSCRAPAAAAGHPVRPGGFHPAHRLHAGTYATFVWAQFLTRLFGYAEEMLCFVVIAEEVAAGARGWANGTLTALVLFRRAAWRRWCSPASISCPMAGAPSM